VEEDEPMPEDREFPPSTPHTSMPGQRTGSEGPGRDREVLVEEALRAQAQEALRDKVGRNDPCPCGSGKKYKRCCLERHKKLFSTMGPAQISALSNSQRAKAECDKRVREGYQLLGRRQFQKACSFARRWARTFPKDDRFRDILVTSFIHLGDPGNALEAAEQGYMEALTEKEHFLAAGCHSWEGPGQAGPGHAYAPEAWLERLWVARKAVAYAQAFPQDPDPRLLQLVKELQKTDAPDRYPEGREEGLKLRKREVAHVLEELKAAGPRALPYLLPLCPRYGWCALMVPELLIHWADPESIRALVEVAMFRYPYLSESCLKGLEQLGGKSLPYLREAFQKEPEMDPLKTGLLSVAGEIGTPEAMEWLTEMLEHPLPVIVNWTAGILGRKSHRSALPHIKRAMERVGQQPYILWALEELEGQERA
jgi:hypothetical protein